MLELVSKIPEEIVSDGTVVFDFQAIANDTALMEPLWFGGIGDYLAFKAAAGTDITYVGIPSPSSDRSGTYGGARDAYSMSSTSQHKEAIWEFLRYFFLRDDMYAPADPMYGGSQFRITGQDEGFPINQKVFDAYVAMMMEKTYITDQNGEEVLQPSFQTMDSAMQMVSVYPAEQEDIDFIMNVLANLDSLSVSYDADIINIIREEAQPYFAGQKTVAEVAEIIDSRVNIYLKERG
jgi:hypothetical protein